MKKRYILILLFIVLLLTGCGNKKTLTCTSIDEASTLKKYSTLTIKVNENKIDDMKFVVDIIFPQEYQNQRQAMINEIKTSKPYMQAVLITDGIRLITEDKNDSFIGIPTDQEISYNELKEVLELQDYTCK